MQFSNTHRAGCLGNWVVWVVGHVEFDLRADRVEPGCPAISPAAFGSALQNAKLCMMYATTRGYMARLLRDHRDEIERGARMYWPVHFENCISLTKRAEQVKCDYADVW